MEIDFSSSEVACQAISNYLRSLLNEQSPHPDRLRISFLKGLNPESRILDVGCGNHSPARTKEILPNCYYIGVDVGNYNQSVDNPADEYLIVSSANFNKAIDVYRGSVDAVISSHNIEHCEDRDGVVVSLARSLKVGGRAFIAFPTEESKIFPKRLGTLNYFEDTSHVGDPPDFGTVVSLLVDNGLKIIYAATRYQPPLDWIVGLGMESASALEGVLKDGTWAYYGFETVIWAERVV